ncbi:cysteine synthase A [Aliidiomarina maris]|uniref:Cysteine synthase n=1 Tax=Aliidiomarina maris TaxID=531312 RepID=A0A327WWX0_9GAMM|nr:cysteine synthase A [Aliidiomarina maris]RAJ96980.1 cysteine synthase A [Aliidiomarina maris]RUO24591.1 cysteine synthase A [Aliidiomarina maris]
MQSTVSSVSIFNDNASSIGRTPLVRLNRVTTGEVYAKIETRNPSNSVKCRIGASMIWAAEASGRLSAGKTIIEATSGNTGIALAFVAAARGYPLVLTMPASMSLERRKLLKALGAEVVLTAPELGMKGAVAEAERLEQAHPDTYVQLHQFSNPANPQIHFDTTGPEIEQALNGAPDIFVAGVGTGGTISGTAKYFKQARFTEQGEPMQAIAVEPADSPIIGQALAGEALTPAPHKIQGIGAGFIPANLDLDLIDGVERVSNEEAMQMAHRLMREEGILAGISSGAAVVAAARLAAQPEHQGKRIVVMIPSSAERYLSTPLFKDVFGQAELEP